MERGLAMTGMVSGGAALVAQSLPVVPDGFGSWQATAICGFISVTCLMVMFWLLKTVFSTLVDQGKNVGTLAGSVSEQSKRMDELCRKQGELVQAMVVTNTKQADLIDEWKRRPCGGGAVT